MITDNERMIASFYSGQI